MSQNGQTAIVVSSRQIPGGVAFDWHAHPLHQLAWAESGVLTMATEVGTWVLPPSRALWVPARVAHALGSSGAATARNLYFKPALCPVNWSSPTVVAVSDLLAALICHLAGSGLSAAARSRAEAVVLDLLSPLSVAAIVVRMPVDDRALRVADALRADPADQRELAAWGRLAGASARTLARVFVTETGLTFGRWRAQVRLEASLPMLASGLPVSVVAHRVGYGSASAFVAAFRRAVGMPPARYFTRIP
jgi:AraC-like DNA-binding protein